jgi:polysaccharide export outer membrane protein
MYPDLSILHLLVLGSTLILGGCSVIPTSGPQAHDIRTGQPDPESLPYAYVPITRKVVDILAARPGNFVTLPPQPVDTQGNISVPYAGAIRAQGRTPTEVKAAIVAALKDRALEPQAFS